MVDTVAAADHKMVRVLPRLRQFGRDAEPDAELA
jgi:hypothetical protein